MYTTKHFTTADNMACHCCGVGGPSIALLVVLEELRRHFNAPVSLTNVARCKNKNAAVGGGKRSEHLVNEDNNWESDAADVVVKGVTASKVYAHLKTLPYANLLGLGLYVEKKFTHVDTRGYGARWKG